VRREIIEEPNPVNNMSSKQKSELLGRLVETIVENVVGIGPYRETWQRAIDYYNDH
jgi:hypothetical protein